MAPVMHALELIRREDLMPPSADWAAPGATGLIVEDSLLATALYKPALSGMDSVNVAIAGNVTMASLRTMVAHQLQHGRVAHAVEKAA